MQGSQERIHASTVIIGAGIVGVSIAYNLTLQGAENVVLIDKSKAGQGSTAAALGGFRYQFSNELSVRLSIESIKIIEDFKRLTGYDPLVKRDGYVFIASKEKSMEHLERNRKLQRKLGVPVERMSKEELEKRFPFYDFAGMIGGNICMEDGHASTLAVHQGFLSTAKQNGVKVFENEPVTAIETDHSHVEGVVTTKRRFVAEEVIIAAGAYSGLVGNLVSASIPIKPYPRKILVTQTFGDGIPWEIPIIIDVDSTLSLGREGKGIIMADNEETKSSFDLVYPQDYDERVIQKAIMRVPALKNASVSYADTGLYEMTPDANPIVSEVPKVEGLYCCAGFAGHGFMHAPIIGELMAELVIKGKTHLDISSFDIRRFQSERNSNKEDLII